MSQVPAIGIMARAPVAGEAKTRLIPALGAPGAADLQRRLTLRALQTAVAAAPGAVTLFTAGDPAHPFWTACTQDFHPVFVEQSGAHLGARMLAALRLLLRDHSSAVLIGTDCPALEASHLFALRDALRHARMAFIPAEDGGYVAVGAREPAAPAFGALDWGSERVMAQTRAALSGAGWRAGRDWIELPPLWDIDRPQDLQRAVAAALLPAELLHGSAG